MPVPVFPAAWPPHLTKLGADEAMLAALAAAAGVHHAGPVLPGRVARAEHSLVTVLTPDGPLRAGLPRGEPLCVGDWVLASREGPAGPAVTGVLPRRTALVRHSASGRTEPQTLVANVDEVFITVASERGIRLGRIERFLTLAWESGAAPVVVLTKGDLLAPGAAGPLMTTAMGAAPGADVHLVSAVTGEGIESLRARLRPGRTAALIGSSGAGKSRLLNTLAGAEVAATSEVRAVDGKGRHKTAWRELVVLDRGGAVIDTPGLRGLGLWLDGGGLDAAFADIAGLAPDCRFSDCRHDTEPGCAVTAAVAAGELEARRLASFRKLEREAAYVARRADPREARAQSRAWAARAREAQGRTRQPSRFS